MTITDRIKVSDIVMGTFVLVIFILFLTVIVQYAVISIFYGFEEAVPFMLSLIISLEIAELIFIIYLLYQRQGSELETK